MSRPDLILWGLHGLLLKPFASANDLADFYGVDEAIFPPVLERLAESGWVGLRTGALQGWVLLPEGLARHDQLVADELAASGSRSRIEDCYHRFGVLNPRLLDLCTRWQVHDGGDGGISLNTHEDPVHDKRLIDELGRLDEQVQPVCHELGLCLKRYAHYSSRLTGALKLVKDGVVEWFAGATIASYHTVWFELHTDLLATLGLDRATETAKATRCGTSTSWG